MKDIATSIQCRVFTYRSLDSTREKSVKLELPYLTTISEQRPQRTQHSHGQSHLTKSARFVLCLTSILARIISYVLCALGSCLACFVNKM